MFILRLTAREMRASWRRLVFFFLCVAVGVGAIVAVRSAVQQVRLAIEAEARVLTAADVVIQSRRPWEPPTRETIASGLDRTAVREIVEAIETVTMVRPADERNARARMVELRAVQQGFPLYGEVTLEGGARFSHELVAGGGVLVGPELLAQLQLQVGDTLVLGGNLFTIRGVLLHEPGRRLGAFSLGPRLLLDYDDLLQTGLLTLGSRARYQMLVRVDDEEIEPLVEELQEELRAEFVSVRSYRRREENISEDLQRAENYLSLIGFVILVLGGLGVWSVVRVFVQQKIPSIATLKCVGATTSQILAAYLLQVFILGLGGSALGVGFAAAAIGGAPRDLAPQLGQLSYALTASAIVQGVAIGVLVSILFSLVPLLEIRRVKPLYLLRQEERGSQRLDGVQIAAAAAVMAALFAVAVWQAASPRIGLYVCGGLAGAAVALHLAGIGLIRAVQPLGRVTWFPLRHAVLSLGRPGNQTRVILLVVGLGSLFIITVRLLQTNLLHEITLDMRPDAPDMFLIDIQQDQIAGVRRLLEANLDGRPFRSVPVLRARVTGVRGRDTNLDGYDDIRGRGSLSREYVITYRDHLEENERVTEGRLWTEDSAPGAEVSIEESIRNRFSIQLGDDVRFDVLGRSVEARVTSVRSVDWDDARSGGFMFVFRSAVFETAPHTYIAVLQGPSDPTARARLQHVLTVAFPNVSAIDVRDLLEIARRIIGNVALAISIIGAVALVSGILILAGSVAMTKFQRLHEVAIFKTLGASSRTIAAMLLLEYGGLGLLAGAIGSAGAVVLTWLVSTQVLEIAWRPAPLESIGGAVLTAVAVAAIGVGSSIDVLRRKPLGTLRAE